MDYHRISELTTRVREKIGQKDSDVTHDAACFAEVFKLTRFRVRTIRETAQKKQRPLHCHLALSNEQELQLCEMIREKTTTGNYVNKRELFDDVEANFRASLTFDCIRYFLERRADFMNK
jgi:hypothetical protein